MFEYLAPAGTLLGKAVELLGGGAFFEKVSHWVRDLNFVVQDCFPFSFPSQVWMQCELPSSCCCHHILTWWTVSFGNSKPHYLLLLPVASAQCSITATRKPQRSHAFLELLTLEEMHCLPTSHLVDLWPCAERGHEPRQAQSGKPQ